MTSRVKFLGCFFNGGPRVYVRPSNYFSLVFSISSSFSFYFITNLLFVVLAIVKKHPKLKSRYKMRV